MLLEGSCHCGAVRFSVRSRHPYPFNLCYCSICRKTAGGGGYAINIKGDTDTLEVEGREQVHVYHARLGAPGDDDDTASPAERHFCGLCASALWLWDPRWPEMVHRYAVGVLGLLVLTIAGMATLSRLRGQSGRPFKLPLLLLASRGNLNRHG